MLTKITALILPLLTRVERVTVTPSLSFCWYPSPTYQSVQYVIYVNEDDLYLALVVDLGAQCRSIRENIFRANSWWKSFDCCLSFVKMYRISECLPIFFHINNFKPKVVAAEAELHPRETPVSRAGDTYDLHNALFLGQCLSFTFW